MGENLGICNGYIKCKIFSRPQVEIYSGLLGIRI